MDFRSDLATEWEIKPDSEGIVAQSRTEEGGVTLHRLCIRTADAARSTGRPQGTYLTVETAPLTDEEPALRRLSALLAQELSAFLPAAPAPVLVAGLGNRRITPDALGPQTTDMVLATRHIGKEFARTVGLSDLRPVAVMAPGVLGQTGVESVEILKALCRSLHPGAVLVVDACAARFADRIGCTVQISNAGIVPGAGVGNHRHAIDREALGTPVITLGVPTVVNADTLVREFSDAQDVDRVCREMVVTPREIDVMIERAARLLAYTINLALQPAYDPAALSAIAT